MADDTKALKQRFAEISSPLSPLPTDTDPQLETLQNIRFVIFDFYGTLFVSGVGDIGIDENLQDPTLLRDVFKACGFDVSSDVCKTAFQSYGEVINRHNERLIKDGYDIPEPAIDRVWYSVLSKLQESEKIHGKVDRQTARRFSVEFEARMNPVWPMPGLIDVFTSLREKNLETGIISNSQFYTPLAFEALTNQTLEELGLNPNLLHWSYEEHLKKPSLKFYKGFLSKLKRAFPGAKPSEVIFVGNDMLKDIYPASTVGMQTALFAGDKRSLKWRRDDERCRTLTPDLVITELTQLTECIA
ncbi:MAG: HAD family hydrolase [Balneolaceae bacterium]